MPSSTRRFNPYLLAGNRVTAALRKPGAAQDGQVPVWDNAAKKFKPGAGGGGGALPDGVVINCGAFNAASGLFPEVGGTGLAGTVRNGNKFTVPPGQGGVVQGVDFPEGAIIIANDNLPGQVLAKWDTIQ